jgi:Cu/Ag efflux pump CusA
MREKEGDHIGKAGTTAESKKNSEIERKISMENEDQWRDEQRN